MKYFFLLLFFLIYYGFAQDVIYDKIDLEKRVDDYIQKYIDLDIFSGVVLIAKDGQPLYHKAFGLANREKNIPNTLNTKFDIGSMNKTFTKVVILQLANEGKISLNDNLGKYLDGFSDEAANKITIDHLLTHQSGFGDYHSPDYFEIPLSEKTISGLLPRIKKMDLMFEPGTDRAYSNTGYIILGAIIEKVTGKSYHRNVRERIVEPLILKETYLTNIDQIPDRAIGYFKDAKGNLHNNRRFSDIPNPDGGFQSTTTDILKFFRSYYYGNELLSSEAKSLDEGFNYFESLKESGKATGQAGGFNGANTVLYEIPRDQISVVVFANMDEPVAEHLGSGILAIIRGQDPKKPTLPAMQNVYKAFKEKGIEFVKNNFTDLTVNFHPDDPKDLILNQLGYDLMFDNDLDDAIQIFRVNTELFPDVANCWDSYGEALLKKGEKEAALKAYKKALEIRPDFPSALKAVEELTN